MEIPEKLANLKKDKKIMTAAAVLCLCGLLLVLLSSLTSGVKKDVPDNVEFSTESGQEYCCATEQRLQSFLRNIDGAGEVRVFLKVGGEQRYVYATEGRKSSSDNKTEEEEKYVLIGGSSGKNALIETIDAPEIEGAVILCSGGNDPAVRERIYKSAAAALGISTSKIYVAKLK